MPRILHIAKSPPYPTTIGGNQRSNLLHRALSRIGETDLLLLAAPDDLSSEQESVLRSSYGLKWLSAPSSAASNECWGSIRSLSSPTVDRIAHHVRGAQWAYKKNPRLASLLAEALQAASYDMVVGSPLAALVQTGALDHSRVVVDTHDLPTEYYESRIAGSRVWATERLILNRHLWQLEELLPPLFRRCCRAFVAKESDRRFPGLQDAVVLPNIPFDDPPLAPARPESRSILFLAAFSHQPNADGAAFLVDEVWPRVRRAVPDASLVIVGSGIPGPLAACWNGVPGVSVRGFVDDLDRVYADSAMTVVPIFWGAGTNIKVVESLGRGRTCVVTPFGHRGYEDMLKDQESLVVASTADAFAARCAELLQDPQRRKAMSERGSRVVKEKFSFERFCGIVDDALRPLLSRRPCKPEDIGR